MVASGAARFPIRLVSTVSTRGLRMRVRFLPSLVLAAPANADGGAHSGRFG